MIYLMSKTKALKMMWRIELDLMVKYYNQITLHFHIIFIAYLSISSFHI